MESRKANLIMLFASALCTFNVEGFLASKTISPLFVSNPPRLFKPNSPIGPSCRFSPNTSLAAKKKKSSTVGKGGKIQVKLTKHIAGTGQAGDIIMVAPAFFEHKLRKSKSAVRISDEEVSIEKAKADAIANEQRSIAMVLKEEIDSLTLTLSRKAGPEGHLFGGVGYKHLLEELKSSVSASTFTDKMKITAIKEAGSSKAMKHDIKTLGEYQGTISLLKGVTADFNISIVED
jgi:large subunit ribosomal protein L9